MKIILIQLILILLFSSCSIKPGNESYYLPFVKFENEEKNDFWKYFRNQNTCKKIEIFDSLMKPILDFYKIEFQEYLMAEQIIFEKKYIDEVYLNKDSSSNIINYDKLLFKNSKYFIDKNEDPFAIQETLNVVTTNQIMVIHPILYDKKFDMKFKNILLFNSNKIFKTNVKDLFQWMFIDIASKSGIKYKKYMETHLEQFIYVYIYPNDVLLKLLYFNETKRTKGMYFELIEIMKSKNNCNHKQQPYK